MLFQIQIPEVLYGKLHGKVIEPDSVHQSER